MSDRQIRKFELKLGEEPDAVAYLRLPTFPADRKLRVSKSVRLVDCMGPYSGPDLVFDFDEAGVLVGIEIQSE